MTNSIDTIKKIAEIIGYITVISAFLTATIKPLRNRFAGRIQKISKTDEQQKQMCELSKKIDELKTIMSDYSSKNDTVNEAILASIESLRKGSAISLGDVIRRIYNSYKDEKKIPEKEYNILDKANAVYHGDLGGNGTIEHIYNEIKSSWDVVVDSIE